MKVAIISTILPHGHYTENLCKALAHDPKLKITLYVPVGEHSPHVPHKILQKPAWRKGLFFFVDIIKAIQKDKPDIVHLQHEFTMYGGFFTAVLFPLLILLLRFRRYKVITTLHAVIAKEQIDSDFIANFMVRKPLYITPFTLRIVFSYIFRAIGKFSNLCICHTNLLRNHVITRYDVPADKVVTIVPVIPEHIIIQTQKEPYFFYYGYMVRRKGIEFVLKGLQQLIKKYPEYKLVMAGGMIPGQEQAFEELQSKIAELGLKNNVITKGFIATENELDILYAKAYAVVIPAKISIAASGPLYHARGYHKCILASRIGNFIEEVQHRENGILVKNNEWYEAMLEMIEKPELVKQMELGAKKISVKNGGEQISKQYQETYIQLMNNLTAS